MTQNDSTIGALRARIARGELTHEALIEQVLDGAAQPAAAHVFTRLYADAALAAARHADAARKAGVQTAPLAGLPVSIKDLYDVAGETTLAGSIACQGEPPAARDATVVTRLRAQGAAIMGRTNMTEFAFSGVGINPHYGTPRNPADAEVARIPGGSSSGAAVSVALGLAVAGLGSDTGGSIRIPAALCGIVGFKSTQSRVPRTGAFELARSLDTVCAMARSVEDCLVADAAIADAPLAVRRRPAQGLRLAVPKTLMFDAIEPGVARAFERAVQALSKAGAQIVEIPLSELAEIGTVNAPGGCRLSRLRLCIGNGLLRSARLSTLGLRRGLPWGPRCGRPITSRCWIGGGNGFLGSKDGLKASMRCYVLPCLSWRPPSIRWLRIRRSSRRTDCCCGIRLRSI